ncbi:hypothetical protein SDC9_72515 [bioreactor metagenome]|uniref:Uncharacterized protein n=1 Tax=bioreactor metagenome TaxID=1076179 RepID=A0A644YIS2_9ZZZZ
MGVDRFLVHLRQHTVTHQDFAVDHGGLALTARHAEEHVAIDVLVGKRRIRLVVHDNYVRRRAGAQNAQRRLKGAVDDFCVVTEQHVGDLAPAHVGKARVVPLGAESHLDRFQHVVGIGVCAHPHQNPLLVQLQNGGDAHGIAHIALGVVDTHGVGGLDDVHLGGVDVDAVAEKRLRSQNIVILQALDGAAAVVLQTVVHVVHTLGHMDVEAHPAVVGGYHPVKGFVGDGEQGVSAEQGLEHIAGVFLTVVDEVLVFLHGLERLLLAVPVGDLIAEAGPHPEFLCDLRNFHQRAGNLAEGGVMVKNGGDALLDGVDHQSLGRGLRGLQIKMPVNGPPGAVQDLVKIGGVIARDAQAAGQSGIDVSMGVDETGHDDAAFGVHEFRLRVLSLQLCGAAHGYNFPPVGDHAAVGVVTGALRVSGNDLSVCQ